jgi:hypothetical protein
VIEILRPFIVVAVTARNEDAMPAEVRELSRSQARERRSNIHCYVLDAKGALAGSFPPFAGRIPDFDPDRMGRTMREGIERAIRGMELPAAAKVEDDRKLHLPDIKPGVRILLSLKGPVPQYRAAVVECVPVGDRERRALAQPEKARSVDAAELRAWLEQLMPPAVMEGMGGVKEISGTLTLEPSGLLGGEVRLVLDDPNGSACTGRLDGIVTWRSGAFATVRAAFEGVFGKHDRMHRGPMDFQMKAAIESRPE